MTFLNRSLPKFVLHKLIDQRSNISTLTSNFNKQDSTKYNSMNQTARGGPGMTNKSFLNKKSDKYVLVNKESKAGKASLNKNVFKVELKSKFDGFEIRAKLLETPCLKASYLIKNVEINTLITEDASKVTFFLDTHCLSFQCDDEILSSNQRPDHSSMKRNKMKDKNMSCTSLTRTRAQTTNNNESLQYHGPLQMNPLDERTNFYLPSISLIGNYSSSQVQLDENSLSLDASNKQLESKKSLKSFSYIDLDFKVAPLSRELNAEVIAQLVFVTKVFIKEMNNILQAVSLSPTHESSNLSSDGNNVTTKPNQNNLQKPSQFTANQSTHLYYSLKLQVGKISFTGITPTNTALSLYTGNACILMMI